MLTPRRSALSTAVLLFAAAAACSDAPPTGPASDGVSEPGVSLSSHAATTARRSFSFPFGPATLPADCLDLGGPVVITGTVDGWIQLAETADGHSHVTEYLDFSGLTASGDGETWAAGPGSHEIFSSNLGVLGDYAVNFTHEGHSLFTAQGDGPDFRLVHRVHQTLTPDFDLTVNEITPLSVQCIDGS